MSLMKAFIGLFFSMTLLAGNLRAAPINDNFSAATTLDGGLTTIAVTASNVDATAEPAEPEHADEPGGASVWWRWTPSENGFATVSTAGSSFDTVLAVYTGSSVAALTEIASNDEDGGLSTSKVQFPVHAGVTYSIAVDGWFGDTGTIQLSINEVTGISAPVNDHYTNATELNGAVVYVYASNFLATFDSSELTPTSSGGASVWYSWIAPDSGRYLLATDGSELDTIISVYRGTNMIAWNDDYSSQDHTSRLHFHPEKGARYYISVQGYHGAFGDFQLQLQSDPPALAPAWILTDSNGAVVNSRDFLGKVLILNFWATWCGPCVAEIPALIAMQETYGKDGLVIVGISTDSDGWQSVLPFMENNGINYISTLYTWEMGRAFGPIDFIPTTIIIDRHNQIQDVTVGSQSFSTFEAKTRPLLNSEASVRMSVSRDGSSVAIKWPVSATGFRLQGTPAPGPVASWNEVEALVDLVDSNNVVRVPVSGAAQCFRLVKD